MAIVTICSARQQQSDLALSGRELDRAAAARGSALLAAFDPAQGPLALVMPCGADFVITLFGALYAGFSVTPLAPPRPGAQANRFNAMIEDCRPSAILCAGGLAKRVQAARLGAGNGVTPTILEVADLIAAASALAPAAADPSRPVIIQYTSGSTRAPRGVLLHDDNILANAELANSTWGMDEHNAMLSWLPHFHDMGLMGGILYPILSGGVTHLMDPLHMIQRPDRWLQLISEKRATFSGGPAFGFAHCLQNVRDEQCEGLDLSSWSSAFCGAEPVPASLMHAFRERFAPYGLNPRAVFGAYGLAEFTLMVTGGIAASSPDEADAPDGCGDVEPCRIAPEMADDLRIVDPDSQQPLADGVAGEVWIRGASMAHGYLNDPAETNAVFAARVDGEDASAGGWLRTGDIAARQADRLYVTGRLKDLLFANGRKIPAPEVEWLAAEQEPALNPMAAAALMPDEMASGKAALVIELRRRGLKIDEDAVRTRIRQVVLGAWGIELTDVRFLAAGALPRTSSGKVQRRAVAQSYRSGEFGHSIA